MKNRLTCGLGVLILVSAVLTVTLTAVVVSAAGKEIKQIKPEEVKKLIESKKTDFVIVDTQPKGAV